MRERAGAPTGAAVRAFIGPLREQRADVRDARVVVDGDVHELDARDASEPEAAQLAGGGRGECQPRTSTTRTGIPPLLVRSRSVNRRPVCPSRARSALSIARRHPRPCSRITRPNVA